MDFNHTHPHPIPTHLQDDSSSEYLAFSWSFTKKPNRPSEPIFFLFSDDVSSKTQFQQSPYLLDPQDIEDVMLPLSVIET